MNTVINCFAKVRLLLSLAATVLLKALPIAIVLPIPFRTVRLEVRCHITFPLQARPFRQLAGERRSFTYKAEEQIGIWCHFSRH